MAELAAILRKKRMKRGSIDFDFPETKVVLDEAGHPIDIKPYDRNVATKLIEDFMLIANETVAEDYFGRKYLLYTEHMTSRTQKKSQSFPHLSIILAIRFILELMRYTQRNFRSF